MFKVTFRLTREDIADLETVAMFLWGKPDWERIVEEHGTDWKEFVFQLLRLEKKDRPLPNNLEMIRYKYGLRGTKVKVETNY